MNIKRNNFWSAAKAIAATLLFGISIGNAQFDVFITEIADPSNAASTGRFVELYNSSDADINLELGNYVLTRWTNDNDVATTSQNISLSGIIPANGFYIVGRSGFEELYGFSPNQISSNGPVDSNGDDKIGLLINGTCYDIFGIAGTVSTPTNGMDFENGRAERAANVTSSQCGWDAIDWNVVSGNVDAPAGFDPGSWIGEPVEEPEVPGTVTFTLADGADNALPENQDHITENVKLTRGSSGALFNIAVETEYVQGVSPLGTFWAIGLTSDNALDNSASYSNLHDAVNGALNGFSEIEGKTFSMHVAGTDKYFDVTFNSWTNGGSGQGGPATRGFSYTRVAVENNESEGPSFSNYTLMVLSLIHI